MIPFIGYTDKLSARPGDTIAFKVHSEGDVVFDAQLIRITSADPNPEGVGIQYKELDATFNGRHPGIAQEPNLGSYIDIPAVGVRPSMSSFSLQATLWPTLPDGGEQVIMYIRDDVSGQAVRLYIDAGGALAIDLDGTGAPLWTLSTRVRLPNRRWIRAWASYDPLTGNLKLGQVGLADGVEARVEADRHAQLPGFAVSHIRIGAGGSDGPAGFFNGKIEAPAIYSTPQPAGFLAGTDPAPADAAVLAAWDFSIGIDSLQVTDTGPHGLSGTAVNMPLRAVTGSTWAGQEMCWRHAPEHYGAIHFHEDDFYDCGWQTAFDFTIPADLPSGVYAARLRRDNGDGGIWEDTLPFFVAPPLGRKSADLCLVIPTFTYIVYGNHWRPEVGDELKERMAAWQAYPWNPVDHREYGLSAYNDHRDGSGIAIISSNRPLMTLKMGFLTLLIPNCGSGLRHFQADTHIVTWLEQQEVPFDIVTDAELHQDGVAALAPYKAVFTASHPEYHTEQSLNAFRDYRDQGGHLAYLGGNGFYWRVAVHPDLPGAIEIRRGEGGIRAWAAEPGEYYNMLDGNYGGLWRRNGRPPQQLAGVGFSSQGKFEGSYYRRTKASYSKAFSWMFAGIDGDILGDFGFSGCGAAGYELDRADPMLGSPDNIVVLAQSEKHADHYVVVPEEYLTHVSTVTGDKPEDLIRADLSWFDTPSGGAVFSTGSITFCGSLPWNNGDNNISRLLRNVLDRFLA